MKQSKSGQNGNHHYDDAKDIYYVVDWIIGQNVNQSWRRCFICWYGFILANSNAERKTKLLSDFIDAYWGHTKWKKGI